MPEPTNTYDALLVVSFGGPEGPDDVLPFLENVLRGRNVPRERMLEVAEHYQAFGGVSPINAQVRELIAALRQEFSTSGLQLPIYWGNRNWHPLLPDTLRQMAKDNVTQALGFVTSAFSSYSGCRQYRENIEAAQTEVGSQAPAIDKLRMFYNHPGFVEVMAESAVNALHQIPPERRANAMLVFTAHSIPQSMADNCAYVSQLEESCRLVVEHVRQLMAQQDSSSWRLVYQSRSGPPSQPWLEPDVCDDLRAFRQQGGTDAVVVPIGFLSDHMEVLFDLDTEAAEVGKEIGLNMVRAATAGTHPRFVKMIRELVEERFYDRPRVAIGDHPPSHDVCPTDCCRYVPRGRPATNG
ncbi:MAG: ferrochelatase [Pirellulales bacterium]|nr:ferrochelatase [Pirellulales bacterium]